MLFLVINKKTGSQPDVEVDDDQKTADNVRMAADALEAALAEGGQLKGAWALLAGGHVYIVEAAHAGELTELVRLNPLSKHCETDIFPIADAVDYLRHYAAYMDEKPAIFA